MKKVLLGMLALPSLLFAQEEYTVKGKIGTLDSPAKIFIQYNSNGERKIDSAAIVKGEFKFHGLVNEPTQAYLILSPDGAGLRSLSAPEVNTLFLSKGVINVTGENLAKASVKGNPLNDEYALYKASTKDVTDAMSQLDAEYAAASPEKQNDPTFIAGLQEKATGIFARQNDLNLKFIADNPKSFVSLTLMDDLLSAETVNNLAVAFKSVPENFKSTQVGKQLSDRINALTKLAIGAEAPDFTLPDTTGTPVALSSLRGKYVLIDFWASWCGPCRMENPNVVAAYNKFKDKGFTILGVSLDRPGKKEDWLTAIQKDQLSQWTNVSDLQFWQSPVVKLYAIQGIPQNYLLDKDGKIVASNLRGAALEEKLNSLLN